jgi:hypothetical protein
VKLAFILATFSACLCAESAKERQLSVDKARLAEQLAVSTQTIATLRESNTALQRQHGSDAATIKLLKSAIPTLTPETKADIDTAKKKLGDVEAAAEKSAELSAQNRILFTKIHEDGVRLAWSGIVFEIGIATILSFIGYLLTRRLRKLTLANIAAELDRKSLSKKMDVSIAHSAEAIEVANHVNEKIAKVAEDTQLVAGAVNGKRGNGGTEG